MHALYIEHRARSGQRDALEAAWRRHMMPAVEANPGHLAYAYTFGTDPDTVAAFQVYRSRDDADAFVRSPEYRAYLSASLPLLEHDPQVTVLEPRWLKG